MNNDAKDRDTRTERIQIPLACVVLYLDVELANIVKRAGVNGRTYWWKTTRLEKGYVGKDMAPEEEKDRTQTGFLIRMAGGFRITPLDTRAVDTSVMPLHHGEERLCIV